MGRAFDLGSAIALLLMAVVVAAFPAWVAIDLGRPAADAARADSSGPMDAAALWILAAGIVLSGALPLALCLRSGRRAQGRG